MNSFSIVNMRLGEFHHGIVHVKVLDPKLKATWTAASIMGLSRISYLQSSPKASCIESKITVEHRLTSGAPEFSRKRAQV